MDPNVRDYLMKKYAIGDDLSEESLRDAQNEARTQRLSAGLGSAANTIGAAIAGTKVDNSFYDKMREDAGQGVKDLQDRRKSVMDRMAMDKMGGEMEDADALKDPNSQRSIAFRNALKASMPKVADSFGSDFDLLSAADQSLIMEPIKLREQLDEKKLSRQMLMNDKAQARALQQTLAEEKLAERKAAKDEKRDKDIRERMTTYGIARTADDAKQLKEATELKKSLDAQINELIALREAKGAELLNRDVVGRAQQLAKDLLLTKKNMEKLGVLSESDKDIVNEIIPSDPTQFHFSQLVGQDPTMTKLKAFKSDTERDFNERLKTRLEGGLPMSTQDRQALEWAKSNPDDPRAIKIMERLKGK